MQTAQDETANPALAPGPREAFLACDVQALRKLLCRPMVSARSGHAQVVDAEEPEPDASLPPDHPPGFGPPEPRESSAFADVTTRFIGSLRKQYGRGVLTDEGRAIGDLPEVQAWLDGLTVGSVEPRL